MSTWTSPPAVLRVSQEFPQMHLILVALYSGWISGFISSPFGLGRHSVSPGRSIRCPLGGLGFPFVCGDDPTRRVSCSPYSPVVMLSRNFLLLLYWPKRSTRNSMASTRFSSFRYFRRIQVRFSVV